MQNSLASVRGDKVRPVLVAVDIGTSAQHVRHDLLGGMIQVVVRRVHPFVRVTIGRNVCPSPSALF